MLIEGIADKAKDRVLTHPALQGVVRRVLNLRADLLDQVDQRMDELARRLNLATRKEVKALRRQIRELENQVHNLESLLGEERRRADRAETSLADALKANKKGVAPAAKKKAAAVEPVAEVVEVGEESA